MRESMIEDTSYARLLALGMLAALVAALALACGGGDEQGSAPSPAPAPQAAPAPAAAEPAAAAGADAGAVREANQVFDLRCVTCHGTEGAGDGPGSASLNPKPRDFRDPAWQDGVSDEHLTAIVLMGGVAVGKSPTMPGNPDLQAKPAVVAALVARIRSLRRE